MRLSGILFLLVLVASCAQAAPPFFERKEEGWFWYKDPKEVDKPKPLLVPLVPAPEPEVPEEPTKEAGPPPFSIAWIRKNLPTALDAALDDPSQEKVATYLYLQRLLIDRSDNFAQAAVRVSALDPLLDENNRLPVATAAKVVAARSQKEGSEEALRFLGQRSGLWFFFDAKCVHCEGQYESLKRLSDKYGFPLLNASADGVPLPSMSEGDWVQDSGQFRNIGLQIYPTTVLAVPPDKYIIVSQGAMSLDMLEERILLAAEDQKLLPGDVSAKVNALSKGILKPSDISAEAAEKLKDPEDPHAWVEYLRERIKASY